MMKKNPSSFTHSQSLHNSHLDQRLWSNLPSRTQSLTTLGHLWARLDSSGPGCSQAPPQWGSRGSLSPTAGGGCGQVRGNVGILLHG